MRTDENLQRYTSLNDSMQHLVPQSLTEIRQEMQQAEDSLTWYDYYLMYGRHFLLSRTPDSLLPYVRQTLQFVDRQETQTPRTRGLAATALSSVGAYHYLLHHNTDTVLSHYKQAYQLMLQSDMVDNLPDLSANIGDAYVARNDLPEGSKWYRRALYLVDSLELPRSRCLTLYMGLGRIYTNIGDFEQARAHYERTDRHFDEMKPNMQSYFLNNYGNYYYFRHDYAEALKTFRRLKALLEQYHSEQYFDMYLCKVNMADVFLNLGLMDSARHYVDQAEQYFEQLHVDAGIYYAHTIRIGIAQSEKKFREVEHILKEEENHDFSSVGYEMEAIRQHYLNKYFAAIGDYRRAYTGLRGNMNLKDSLEQERKRMRSEDIMMRLTEDTIRLHHQLEMNRREAIYERHRNWGFFALGIAIIITLAIALWFNHERKRYLQNYLDMMKLRLANTRQRISPHFMFNVLNSRIAEGNQQEGDQLIMLTQLMRANLELTHKTFVTLKEELDFVSKYVDIERRVSGLDFNFRVETPDEEELKRIMLPSMLIQILVENAILHGLKEKENDRQLVIKVESDMTNTRISVIDNGPGFDIRRGNSERTRTGLNIIRSTVNIVNQENKKAKMHFDIKNDNGCHAILTIAKNIKYQ
jgi:tetratricopeptide (TPR) repeat protein